MAMAYSNCLQTIHYNNCLQISNFRVNVGTQVGSPFGFVETENSVGSCAVSVRLFH